MAFIITAPTLARSATLVRLRTRLRVSHVVPPSLAPSARIARRRPFHLCLVPNSWCPEREKGRNGRNADIPGGQTDPLPRAPLAVARPSFCALGIRVVLSIVQGQCATRAADGDTDGFGCVGPWNAPASFHLLTHSLTHSLTHPDIRRLYHCSASTSRPARRRLMRTRSA
jgi:hypothetical protein